MLGVFRAACWPQQNIDPHAWAEEGSRGGSRFPLQVRVRMDSPTVLVLSEERVRSALEYRGSLNRFDLQMSKEAASSLALLFQQYGEPRPLQQAGLPMPMPMPGGGGPMGRGLKSEGGGVERDLNLTSNLSEGECDWTFWFQRGTDFNPYAQQTWSACRETWV